MAYTSLTSAQTDAKSPIDEQMMDLIRTNEDDLDARTTVLEDQKDVSDYVDNRFDDGVVAADDPIIGAANTDLTSTASTNPNSLSLADMRGIIGKERVYTKELKLLPIEADATDLPARVLTTDNRITFYGDWKTFSDTEGVYVGTTNQDDYFLATGVCDSFGVMCYSETAADAIDVDVDGAASPTTIVVHQPQATADDQGHGLNSIVSHSDFQGLGQDIHTFKVSASTLTGTLKVFGVEFVSSATYQGLAGKAFVDKILQTFAEETLTLPTPGIMGSRSIRYMDRADNTRKWATQDVEAIATTGGAFSSGATSITVADSSSFELGDIVKISDGTEWELIRYSATSGGTNMQFPGPGLVNNYGSPSAIERWCSTFADGNIDLSDHEYVGTNSLIGYGTSAETSSPTYFTTTASDKWFTKEDGVKALVCDDVKLSSSTDVVGVDMETNGDSFTFYTNASGLALYIKNETTNASIVRVSVDNVIVGTFADNDDRSIIQPIYANAPIQSHQILVEKISATTDDRTYVSIIEYKPPRHSDLSDQQKGGELFEIMQPPTYEFNPNSGQEQISHGVFRMSPRQEWFYDDVTTGNEWAVADLLATPFGFTMDSNAQAGGEARYHFFGTGFELNYRANTDAGQWDIEIDGTSLISGNFGGVTFVETDTGAYDFTTNGRLESYKASASHERISFTGFTLGYHEIALITANSKNASSADFNLRIAAIDIITPSLNIGSLGNTESYSHRLSDALDLRRLTAIDNIQTQGKNTYFHKDVEAWVLAVNTGITIIPGSTKTIESRGLPMAVDFNVAYTPSATGQYHFYLIIDGKSAQDNYPICSFRRNNNSTTNDNSANAYWGPFVLEPGFHDIGVGVIHSGGSSNMTNGGAVMAVFEV